MLLILVVVGATTVAGVELIPRVGSGRSTSLQGIQQGCSSTSTYTSSTSTTTSLPGGPIILQVAAEGPLLPGQTGDVATVLTRKDNGSFVNATSIRASFVEPNGTRIGLGMPIFVHTGFYVWKVNLHSDALLGDYKVIVLANVSSVQLRGFTDFQVIALCAGNGHLSSEVA